MTHKFTYNINGVEVVAETTYADTGEFGLKLTQPEFDACFNSLHIMIMARTYRRFFNPDGTPHQYGLETAERMAAGLYEGYLLKCKYAEQLHAKVDEIVSQLCQLERECEHAAAELNLVRGVYKQKFNDGEITVREYSPQKREIEAKTFELRSQSHARQTEIISKAYAESVPGITVVGKKCCGTYTGQSALSSYFWHAVEKKRQELVKGGRR